MSKVNIISFILGNNNEHLKTIQLVLYCYVNFTYLSFAKGKTNTYQVNILLIMTPVRNYIPSLKPLPIKSQKDFSAIILLCTSMSYMLSK